MKRLKFLIVVFGLIAAQGVFAVTLPSTSYTPYSGSDAFSSESAGGGLTMVKGAFDELGTVDPAASGKCVGASPGVPSSGATCSDCCITYYNCGSSSDPDCGSNFLSCINGCEQGPSLPLDAPLWFMLALAALGTVVTLSVVQRSEESRNLR